MNSWVWCLFILGSAIVLCFYWCYLLAISLRECRIHVKDMEEDLRHHELKFYYEGIARAGGYDSLASCLTALEEDELDGTILEVEMKNYLFLKEE